MKVELYRLSAEPITVEVEADATVKQVLSAPGTGAVLGDEDHSLLEAAERRYGGLDQLGTLRVNGSRTAFCVPWFDSQRLRRLHSASTTVPRKSLFKRSGCGRPAAPSSAR